MRSKTINNNEVSSAKTVLFRAAKKKLNGPLVIGIVLSPSLIMLLIGFISISYDPSGITGAFFWIVFTVPAIVSVILIVAGLSKALESRRLKRRKANPKIVQNSYRYTYLVTIIIIIFFDLILIYYTWNWVLSFTSASVLWLTIMVILLGLSVIPIVINIRNYRRIIRQSTKI
jgi:hypothetical protein